MKKIHLIFAALFNTLLFLPMFVAAQENQAAEWIRVQSDNGEFSIEVPAKYIFIADKSGFLVSDNSNNYSLEEMKMLNAYREKTLLSFESYRASKKALNSVRDNERVNGKSSEIQREGFSIKQILIKTDKSYTIRQYFNSKNYIYILTAASRNGETAVMKRFLNSLIFKLPDSAKPEDNRIAGAIPFSALKISPIEIVENPEPYKKPDNQKPTTPPTDENALPLLLVNRQAPSYTEAARMSSERGIVQTRLTFSQEGYISKVGILKTLKYGLVRQAFFAALRIKFLPVEKDEKPQTITKIVEYSFDIY